MSKLISQPEACKLMGVSRWTFADNRPKMARMGVHFYQPFKRVQVDLDSLLRYIEKTRTKKSQVGIEL